MVDSRTQILNALQQGLQQAKPTEAREEAAVQQTEPCTSILLEHENLLPLFGQRLAQVGGELRVAGNDTEVIEILSELLGLAKGQKVLIAQDTTLIIPNIGEIIEKCGAEVSTSDSENPVRVLGPTYHGADASLGITTAQAGIADTGTVVLCHTPERGRLAGLLPPHHVVLLSQKALYPNKLAFLKHAQELGIDLANTPMTWVTGPSLTADIEKVLVRGAHGPRQVTVIVY